MDPPTKLPPNATREELAAGKINWLPAEKERGRKEEEKGGGTGGMKKGVKEMVKANGTGSLAEGRQKAEAVKPEQKRLNSGSVQGNLTNNQPQNRPKCHQGWMRTSSCSQTSHPSACCWFVS